jgi:hypothetical protein
MNPLPDRPENPTPPPAAGCAAFEAMVQSVLDRGLSPDALHAGHAAGCPDCRALAAATRRLLDAAPHVAGPPPGLSDRIVAAALWDRRVRRRRRFAGAALAAVAASLLIAGGAVYYSRPVPNGGPDVAQAPPTPPPAPKVPEAPPPRVSDEFAEAGSAVVAITRKATDQAVAPTRTLLPPPGVVSVPVADALPGIEPAAESLAGVPEAARSGIEPVADKTRRAVNLFLRDVGIGQQAKPKS